MAIYFIIPDAGNGGDDQMRFVVAATPQAALEYVRIDLGDFPMEFNPCFPASSESCDEFWRVYEIAEPRGALKHLAVIPWDKLPTTWWKSNAL